MLLLSDTKEKQLSVAVAKQFPSLQILSILFFVKHVIAPTSENLWLIFWDNLLSIITNKEEMAATAVGPSGLPAVVIDNGTG